MTEMRIIAGDVSRPHDDNRTGIDITAPNRGMLPREHTAALKVAHSIA